MRLFTLAALVAMIGGSVQLSSAQTILGNRFDLREKPGYPVTRKLVLKAQEALSPENLVGDPFANGAVVQLFVNGGTPSSQTIVLPGGPRWRVSMKYVDPIVGPIAAWRYRESLIFNGGRTTPVRSFDIAKSGAGKIKLAIAFDSKYVSLDVGVPNPGTYAGMVLTIPGGATFCVNFGGVAGGTFKRNDSTGFSVSKPPAEGVCATGTATCGDGIVDSPSETCDVNNDAACPGLCGSNGLACLCPFCGDATIDPGESCDTQGNLGTCSEGCSHDCTCAVCGDGIVQTPVEECEDAPGLGCYVGTCAPPGDANQCHCPICGDGQITQGEECEPTDDSACPGHCTDGCLCAVCGNNVQEPGEECDGTDSGCGVGECLPNCTCSVCGNGILESPPEQCESTDDSACPGLCNTDCVCGVCGNNFTDYPQEQCDGTDDGACPGLCQVNCTCP
jgi:hypothetical protein